MFRFLYIFSNSCGFAKRSEVKAVGVIALKRLRISELTSNRIKLGQNHDPNTAAELQQNQA